MTNFYTQYLEIDEKLSANFNIDEDYFFTEGEDLILMVWKSNVKNMDDEFNTLIKIKNVGYTISNQTKINLEESKSTSGKNYINNLKAK